MSRASAKPARSRVFLVDDHVVVRSGLAELIGREPDLAVCGAAADAEDALQSIPRARPDLVLVDLSLPGTSGLELVKDLKRRCPKLPVLVLSMHEESLYAERVLQAGARGYVMKDKSFPEIRAAMRRVLAGRIYLSEEMSDRLLQTVAGGPAKGSPLERLSDRELEVFEMIGRGLGTAAIARKLHLSVKTVETHRAHIKEKLNLDTGAELVQQAVHWLHRL